MDHIQIHMYTFSIRGPWNSRYVGRIKRPRILKPRKSGIGCKIGALFGLYLIAHYLIAAPHFLKSTQNDMVRTWIVALLQQSK